MINWAHFPQSDKPPLILNEVVSVFQKHAKDIDSAIHEVQVSDEVLAKVADSLEEIGFEVERGKKKEQKIHIPVLYGMNGVTEKAFEADGYHKDGRVVIEVEALLIVNTKVSTAAHPAGVVPVTVYVPLVV